MNMGKTPREVSGFIPLAITFKSPVSSASSVTHFLYVRPHDPKTADEDASRSLFLVNIPVTTTESHLRHLFSTQLSAGRVEKIYFSEDAPGRASVARSKTPKSKKRKRATAEEAEAGLDAFRLPNVSESAPHASGATAIVVFVDRPSMELSLKAAKKAIKIGQEIFWAQGIKNKAPLLGLKRYQQFNERRYPSSQDLLHSVDQYMAAYAELADARSKENARKRQVPDEDGFITVTRGSKGGLRKEDAEQLGAKQKKKTDGLLNFYRFQMREKRKEQQEDMLRKFEEDRKKVSGDAAKKNGRLTRVSDVAMDFLPTIPVTCAWRDS